MQRTLLGNQALCKPAIACHPLPLHRCLGRPVRLNHGFVARPRRSLLLTRASATPPNSSEKAASSGWRAFWATVDTGAWLGTVGTAIAFLLTQEALLVGGPIALPLIALYASRQRGKLDSAVAQAELQAQVAAALRQVSILSEESAAEVAEEVAALVDEVRQGRTSPEKAVRSVETKLSSVEGSVREIESSTKQALEEAAAQRSRAVKELSSALATLRRDVNADLRQATGDELAALGRVDSRLAALEGAISGLEVAQSEGLRRLSSSMTGALMEGKDALAAAVRDEVWQSLEPVRQLPQALAAAAPALTADRSGLSQLNEDSLRSLVSEEISSAVEELLEQQRTLLQEAMSAPATIAPAQWNQLGKRLVTLDGQLTALREGQEVQLSSLAGNGTEFSGQLSALRKDLNALSQSLLASMEQQQTAQRAALALAAQPAAAEQLLLAPLEAALLQLQNEMRVEAETAAVDRSAAESNWVVTLETKLVRLITPVLEAIAATRTAAAASVADQSPEAQAAASEQQQLALEQALAGIATVSEQLGTLGNRIADMEAGILEERKKKFSTTRTRESVGSSPAPPRDVNPAAVATAASVVGPFDTDIASTDAQLQLGKEEEERTKAEAYAKMRSMLHSQDNVTEEESETLGNGNKSTAATSSSGGDAAETVLDKEAARAEAYAKMQSLLHSDENTESDSSENSTAAGTAGTGVPISAWLSGDTEDETKSITSYPEVVGTAVGGNPAPAASRNVLLQEQIAFEASLAAAEDLPPEEFEDESVLERASERDAIEEQQRRESGAATKPLEDAQAPAAPPATAEAQSSQQGEQQELVDLDLLYAEGLELLRQGRALASEGSIDGNWQALDDADAVLQQAIECFQTAATAGQGASSIKALGNSGNALMARARVKRQIAQFILDDSSAQYSAESPEGIAATEEANALLAEAKELLVVAGRKYREVLQNDPTQGRAFVNWGRAVCLRAEMAKEAKDFSGAYSLFNNAAGKFQAALQLDAEPMEGMRLAGSALASAAGCLGRATADEEEAWRGLMEDAESYLTASVNAGAGKEAIVKLQEVRKMLGWD